MVNDVVMRVKVNVAIKRATINTTITIITNSEHGENHHHVQDIDSKNFDDMQKILKQAEEIACYFDVPLDSHADIKEMFWRCVTY